MSKTRDDFVRIMRSEKKWIVVPIGLKEVSMHRKIGKHPITVRLEETPHGNFNINPASYIYNSSCSHFTYAQKEVRWSRNKMTFQAILKALKNSLAIDYINNLDEFIVINNNCKKSNKKKLAEDLKDMTTVLPLDIKKKVA
jgi:hypothetical protein